jgi:uncharacterized membrane protein YfcA
MDYTTAQITFLFLSTVAAFVAKGITGFGNTLVMGPLYSFVLPNRTTTPIDLLFSIPTNAYLVWKDRKSLSLRAILPLALAVLAGILPGVWLLDSLNSHLVKALMGLVVIGSAIVMVKKNHAASPSKGRGMATLVVIGVFSGILTGLYGISAFLVVYLKRSAGSRNEFRANLCSLFLLDNMVRVFLYFYTGLLTPQVLFLALLLSPAVVIGLLIGRAVDSRLSDASAQRIVVVLLIASGVTLFVVNSVSI